MDYIGFNIVPITAATVAGFLAGLALRALGGRTHTRLLPAIVALLAQFWLTAILAGALILAPAPDGVGPWAMALASAAVIWIGFVLPTTIGNYVQRGLSPRAIVTDAFGWLVIMLVEAAVLRAVGVGLAPGLASP